MLTIPHTSLKTVQALAEAYPGEVWAGKISDDHSLGRTTVNAILKRFADEGYITTRVDKDGRRLMAKLTDEGVKEYKRIRETFNYTLGVQMGETGKNGTPYTETELLLAVINEDYARVNRLLQTMSRSQATHLAQQVKNLGTILAVYGQGD